MPERRNQFGEGRRHRQRSIRECAVIRVTARGSPQFVRRRHLVLAAGAGRRYGKPKVLVEGWLETAVGALRDGGCAEVVLVLGAAEVPAPPGVAAIIASDWDEGLSASVRAGLLQAEVMDADYAVLHVIDTPDVGPAVVARVLGRALASRRRARARVFRRPSGTSRRYRAPTLARGAGKDIRRSGRGGVSAGQARRRGRRLRRPCRRSGRRRAGLTNLAARGKPLGRDVIDVSG